MLKKFSEWIMIQSPKIQLSVAIALIIVVLSVGTMLSSGYQTLHYAYTEYRIREDIKQFDTDKNNLIKNNNLTIKKYRQDILDMEACNTSQKL